MDASSSQTPDPNIGISQRYVFVGMLSPPRHPIRILVYPRGLCLYGCLLLPDTRSQYWYIPDVCVCRDANSSQTPDPSIGISQRSVFIEMLTPPRHPIPILVYLGVCVFRDAYSFQTPDPNNGISQRSVFVGMLTPSRHPIPILVYPGVCVCRDAYSSQTSDHNIGISGGLSL
jgi:hypothetical protein